MPKKDPVIKTLSREIAPHHQGFDYQELLTLNAHKLRILIHVDSSFKFQSSARIERYDGTAWQEVAHIAPASIASTPDFYGPGSTMRALYRGERGVINHDTEANRAAFSKDRETLLERAIATLL